MPLGPYLANTNPEVSLLFNRTDFVKRDVSTILISKGLESEESGEVPPLPPPLNFLEDCALTFQYFGFRLYPITF